jgi:hypothetical protein
MRRAIAVPCLLLAAACASPDRYAEGMRDGARGAPSASREEHYEAGRREGLMLYCTEQRGFEEGRAGRPYGSVCPEELAADYRDGYRRGREAREKPQAEKPL